MWSLSVMKEYFTVQLLTLPPLSKDTHNFVLFSLQFFPSDIFRYLCSWVKECFSGSRWSGHQWILWWPECDKKQNNFSQWFFWPSAHSRNHKEYQWRFACYVNWRQHSCNYSMIHKTDKKHQDVLINCIPYC